MMTALKLHSVIKSLECPCMPGQHHRAARRAGR